MIGKVAPTYVEIQDIRSTEKHVRDGSRPGGRNGRGVGPPSAPFELTRAASSRERCSTGRAKAEIRS